MLRTTRQELQTFLFYQQDGRAKRYEIFTEEPVSIRKANENNKKIANSGNSYSKEKGASLEAAWLRILIEMTA